MILLFYITFVQVVLSWPDGAPCLHAAYESMNPLEAVEHQGGLQLTMPPYMIKVDQKCYWRNQPLTLHLQGINETVWYKGFVIQPFEWNDGKLGNRMGQLMRLDDNGSWQQQCFRFKNSATHSHDEKKKHMRLWWKIDEDSRTVQFVATVVKHQTMFWVKSVLSVPIPPCRLLKQGIEDYKMPMPTPPPPVKQFKMDSNRAFGNEPGSLAQPDTEQPQTFFTTQQPQTFTTQQPQTFFTTQQRQTFFTTQQRQTFFTTQPPQTTQVNTAAPSSRMKQIIPLTDGFQTRPSPSFQQRTSGDAVVQTTPPVSRFTATPQQRPRQQITFTRPQTSPMTFNSFRRPQNTFTSLNPTRTNNRAQPIRTPAQPRRLSPVSPFCFDRDGPERCVDWVPYCRSERFFTYMRTYCTRSCGFC